ncbi:MAG: TIGR00269 family protein [Candidatus Njordarchaeota archaeon]
MYVYYKRDAGKYFSYNEFLKFIEKKTLRTIQKYDMLKHDDVIAVAVSGGKDSLALLYVLDKIEKKYNTEIVIIHVDEGIKDYSEYSEPIVREHARILGYRIFNASFRELFGYTIDNVAELFNDKKVEWEPCSFCGEWRRWALNYLATKAGATVLITAHTLDDFAQTILLNIMRNSLDRLLRLSYSRKKIIEGFVPRVYPFMELYEKETALYTHLLSLEHNDEPCPYAEMSMRWNIRMFLYSQEEKHPGILYNILRFHQNLIQKIQYMPPVLNKCEICGFPTPQKICRAHFFKKAVDGVVKSKSEL